MSKSYKVTVDDDDEDGIVALMLLSFVFTAIVTIIAVVLSVFAAFGGVGAIWGIISSFKNYINEALHTDGFCVKDSVINAWNANVESMKSFFDKANEYDGILPILVKTFLVMAGVGVIVFGTIVLPLCVLLHVIYMFFWRLFHKKNQL